MRELIKKRLQMLPAPENDVLCRVQIPEGYRLVDVESVEARERQVVVWLRGKGEFTTKLMLDGITSPEEREDLAPEGITVNELKDMSWPELQSLGSDLGVYEKGISKQDLIEAILDS